MAVGVRKQQAARTEAELKAAAVRAFERLGYLNTKITDITAEAGRAAGSFYTHFANKESLLEALLADLLAQADESVVTPGHGDDFRDRDVVRWHVAAYWDFYRRYRTTVVALQQAATVDESFARRSLEMMEPDLRHIADHLQNLDLPGDPLVVASMFSTLVSNCADLWLSGRGPQLGRELSDDEAIETLTSFLHAGIGGTGGSGGTR
ncbi:TetR/AcrR family transcriptional regulator [Streptomyces fildesensis]|uniref:TetR/AcrR family transcriptional regulator n=1 Tax=Streptomyces fildesensis TaxID=375757 RepID=A0ABW8C937_9ACTN